MLDVFASARDGPVAQWLEQGTHNPMFALANELLLSCMCER